MPAGFQDADAARLIIACVAKYQSYSVLEAQRECGARSYTARGSGCAVPCDLDTVLAGNLLLYFGAGVHCAILFLLLSRASPSEMVKWLAT